MANVTFSGNVSAQAAPGETVTIIVTAPDSTKTTVTGTTDASGNFTTTPEAFTVGGTYNFEASVPADAQYNAASATGTFTITVLQNRTLTINVTVA